MSCGILINDIPDHFPVVVFTKYYIHKDYNRQYMCIGEKDIFCLKKHKNRLYEEYLSYVMTANDVNMSYDKFINIFSHNFHECYAIRNICLDETNEHKPWICRGLLKDCMNKKQL